MSEPLARALWDYLQLAFIVLALLQVILFVIDIVMPIKWRYWLTRKCNKRGAA